MQKSKKWLIYAENAHYIYIYIYNVHCVQYAQIYSKCEQPPYNFIALKKGVISLFRRYVVLGDVQKRFFIMDQAYGFYYC